MAQADAALAPDMGRPRVTADGIPLKGSLRRASVAARSTRSCWSYLSSPSFSELRLFRLPTCCGAVSTIPPWSRRCRAPSRRFKSGTGRTLPSEEVYAALVQDLIIAQEERSVGRLAIRLN